MDQVVTNSVRMMDENVTDLSHAIVLEVKDNIDIGEYLNAVGKIINPKEIIFASQVSEFVCMFLSSWQLADTLIFKNKEIDIKGHKLKIKPLQATIIALENVFPTIPNDLIKEKFQQYNIKIREFRCGIYNKMHPNYSHVRTFKRYVSVNSQVPILPPILQIEHAGVIYAIKVAILKFCSACYKIGHIATSCNFVNCNPEQNFQDNSIKIEPGTFEQNLNEEQNEENT
ncbi:uncharacterized protein LOC114878886 [Osmia bicornis bicornis]|uniref:uncharacterized protein LOC114878886 n=1 Tax=Osmia bicornis bicornis TaxID=1437191 RepID=UPI001EAEC10E|nr:uncharacterized protein LOC114878886 [Osmia bicornis bicornis]